jgi:hypothetical protein
MQTQGVALGWSWGAPPKSGLPDFGEIDVEIGNSRFRLALRTIGTRCDARHSPFDLADAAHYSFSCYHIAGYAVAGAMLDGRERALDGNVTPCAPPPHGFGVQERRHAFFIITAGWYYNFLCRRWRNLRFGFFKSAGDNFGARGPPAAHQ